MVGTSVLSHLEIALAYVAFSGRASPRHTSHPPAGCHSPVRGSNPQAPNRQRGTQSRVYRTLSLVSDKKERAAAMTAFDTLQAAHDLEAAGMERGPGGSHRPGGAPRAGRTRHQGGHCGAQS